MLDNIQYITLVHIYNYIYWWFQAGKVQYVVETGRLDGKVSLFDDAIDNLPSPKISVSGSIAAFAKKKLSIPDMVYLLGMYRCVF